MNMARARRVERTSKVTPRPIPRVAIGKLGSECGREPHPALLLKEFVVAQILCHRMLLVTGKHPLFIEMRILDGLTLSPVFAFLRGKIAIACVQCAVISLNN